VLVLDAVRGAVAGGVATWLMDLVTTGIYAVQPPEVTAREQAAQANGRSSVANLVDRVEAEVGMSIPKERRPAVEQVVHYALGVVPGAIYGVVRRWIPFARLGSGLAYGVAVFALNDEYLNTALGLAGPARAYPIETHVRGFAGHAVMGVATESGIQLLGG
jgi:uncharacterized membrane protein YagU involved in acid resistance